MTEHPRPPASPRRTRTLPPWSLLAAGAVAGGLIGGAYGALKPPVYTATAYVVAVPTEKSDPASALGFAQAYGRVATQLAVLGDAQVAAGVPARTLQRHVQTATSPDAPMVSITATAPRADLAADMANAVSRALTAHAESSRKTTKVELQQFARAVRPTDPSSASPALTGPVGASAGGLLGGLALLARPRRDREQPDVPVAVPGPAHAADLGGAL
ncbi:lipopolysaccharide biosynthesis protein [Streptomyces sp. NPDC049687]|uniref:lipopolysaccharide biosynthesis protein n=1 Tax=Streptomyces sp. NPDC049687 TaxID=3365596 RepID=UPI00379AF959